MIKRRMKRHVNSWMPYLCPKEKILSTAGVQGFDTVERLKEHENSPLTDCGAMHGISFVGRCFLRLCRGFRNEGIQRSRYVF